LFETDRVVPVVIFLRGTAPRYRLDLGGDRSRYLSFHYLACELGTLGCEDYLESDNIVARLNLPSMRYGPDRKLAVYAAAVRGLVELEPDPEKKLKYLDFIDIYADLDDDERARYQREYPQEAATMGTFSERFLQQGLEQGLAQGEHIGVRKGEARVLLRLCCGSSSGPSRRRSRPGSTRPMQKPSCAGPGASYRPAISRTLSGTMVDSSGRAP
jgi:hypothetical protein